MNNLTFNKKDVITRLQDNREAHQKQVNVAWDNYRKIVKNELREILAQVEASEEFTFRSLEHLHKPADFTRQYDTAIEMLNLSQETHVQLTSREFASYMRDDWEWKDDFAATNFNYFAGLRKWKGL